MVSFVQIKKLSLKNMVSAINIKAEGCLDPENRKKHNLARYTGDQ